MLTHFLPPYPGDHTRTLLAPSTAMHTVGARYKFIQEAKGALGKKNIIKLYHACLYTRIANAKLNLRLLGRRLRWIIVPKPQAKYEFLVNITDSSHRPGPQLLPLSLEQLAVQMDGISRFTF